MAVSAATSYPCPRFARLISSVDENVVGRHHQIVVITCRRCQRFNGTINLVGQLHLPLDRCDIAAAIAAKGTVDHDGKMPTEYLVGLRARKDFPSRTRQLFIHFV